MRKSCLREQGFGAKMREKKSTIFVLYKDPEAALGAESATREARDQVFVAGPGTIFVPYKDPEAAFGTESATREARCGPELDWEKLWRGQVFGDLEDEKKLFA